jgi:hypothetical protein
MLAPSKSKASPQWLKKEQGHTISGVALFLFVATNYQPSLGSKT